MMRKTVLLVQPALAQYRIPLLTSLQNLLPMQSVHVLAANRDQDGVVSVHPEATNFSYVITPNSKMFWGVCWQPAAVVGILKLRQSDTLVLTGNPRYIFNVVAAYIARIKGVDVIWWGQLWSVATSSRSLRAKIAIMSIVPTKVLMYTKREARLLSRILPDKPIYYLNNGIENSNINRLRRPYVAAQRLQRILFLGRLTPKANIELLLLALAKVENLSLDIVGGSCSLELQHLINDKGLQSRIAFYGEVTDEEEIATIANQCLFFVYPGAVGLSLIHAFNYGLPVLVHDQRRKHMPEIAAFKPGLHGETFIRQNHDSLAGAIARMANDFEKLDSYSRNALRVSETDYNTNVMAARFATAINPLP